MSERDLGKLRDSLLARSGGRLPPPDDFKRRATVHDALRSFAAKVQDWNCGVRAQLLGTLDLSGFGTMPNVFGARILVADRPFRRDNWFEAGDAKGTVEQMSTRPTSIHAGDDSLLVVPNGKLAHAMVNNLGARRHRVFEATLLVIYPTAPNVLAAFKDGLLALANDVPHVRPGSAAAGVTSIGADGAGIELCCCLDVRTLDNERTDCTALMLGVLHLVDRMRVRLGQQDPNPAAALEAIAA